MRRVDPLELITADFARIGKIDSWRIVVRSWGIRSPAPRFGEQMRERVGALGTLASDDCARAGIEAGMWVVLAACRESDLEPLARRAFLQRQIHVVDDRSHDWTEVLAEQLSRQPRTSPLGWSAGVIAPHPLSQMHGISQARVAVPLPTEAMR